ncbi:MAG: hypothetical protein V4436_00800 [Patescibacteria group bacterium]
MQRKIRAIAIVYTPALHRALGVCAALAALLLFLYGFFLLEAVAHTASRSQAQHQIQSLTSKLSTLEESYLLSTRDMTLEKAHTLGFVTPKEVSTVYVTDHTQGLSLQR